MAGLLIGDGDRHHMTPRESVNRSNEVRDDIVPDSGAIVIISMIVVAVFSLGALVMLYAMIAGT